MKKIVYTRPDGGVSIWNLAEGARLARKLTVGGRVVFDAAVSKTQPVRADTVGMWPKPNAVAEWAETELEFALRMLPRLVPPDGIGARVVDSADVPTDRTFRNAWRDAGAAVTVDMPKAREIHREHLRAMRAPLLEALDVEYQRADERGDAAAKASIAARKQALRDATADPMIDAAATPAELKTAIPAALR